METSVRLARPEEGPGTAGTRAPVLEPRAAAVDLQDAFRRLARALRPGDASTQDDLAQEMSLAALECAKPHTESYFLQLGVSRALNYLRWWDEPLCVPLQKKHEEIAAPEPQERPCVERCRKALEPLTGAA